MADSIKQVGLLEPLIVRPVGDGYDAIIATNTSSISITELRVAVEQEAKENVKV